MCKYLKGIWKQISMKIFKNETFWKTRESSARPKLSMGSFEETRPPPRYGRTCEQGLLSKLDNTDLKSNRLADCCLLALDHSLILWRIGIDVDFVVPNPEKLSHTMCRHLNNTFPCSRLCLPAITLFLRPRIVWDVSAWAVCEDTRDHWNPLEVWWPRVLPSSQWPVWWTGGWHPRLVSSTILLCKWGKTKSLNYFPQVWTEGSQDHWAGNICLPALRVRA